MTYTTTAKHLGHDQAAAEVEFVNPNRGHDPIRGVIAEVTHYMNPDNLDELNGATPWPVTTAVRMCGAKRVEFLPPDTPVTVAGERPTPEPG